MKFSPVFTVDLALSISVHLASLPSCKGIDMLTLFEESSEILNGWTDKILARKLSVSLEAITWNALRLAGSSGEDRDLKKLGEYLISVAEQVQGFALGKQALDLAKMSLARTTKPIEDLFTAAFKRQAGLSFSKASRAITSLKSSHDAGVRLKEYLMWMRHGFSIDPEFQHELDKLLAQPYPRFSQAAVDLLREYYRLFMEVGSTTKKLESRLFGTFGKDTQKNT